MERSSEEITKMKEILNGKITDLPFSLNALQVVAKRYLLRTHDGDVLESPEDMFMRVAATLAQVEKRYGATDTDIEQYTTSFYDVMSSFEFTPAGRTITNAGGPTRVVSNCIVLHPQDTMDSIFATLREAGLLQQAGSGLGFPFHLLRPAGFITKASYGIASGPVSFLHVYNTAFGVIKQQNRHGANMAVMRVDHPDILEFVHCKNKEGDIRNFNVSVGLTNEFMERVKNNDPKPWLCTWNGTPLKPRRIYRDNNFVFLGAEEATMTAREIFQEIIECAWKTGEPGCVFLDKVNETNPIPGLGRIEACNPCVSGDTKISTEQGLISIKEIAEKYSNGGIQVMGDYRVPIEFHNRDGSVNLMITKHNTFHEISQACMTGIKEVYNVETKEGYSVEATVDHKIQTEKGLVAVQDLQIGDTIFIQSGEGRFNKDSQLPFDVLNTSVGENGHTYTYNFPTQWNQELGQIIGWNIGDGWLRDVEKEYMVGFSFGEEDREVMNYLKPIINKMYGNETQEIKRENGVYHLDYNAKLFVDYMKHIGIIPSNTKKLKVVPETLFTAPREAVIGFLQGIFSSDGTVRDNPKSNSSWVCLTSKSNKLLKGVQLLLLNFGIKSTLLDRSRKPRKGVFKYITKKGEKREYNCDGVLYELGIFGESREKFKTHINFLNTAKRNKLENIKYKIFYKTKYTTKIKSISHVGKKEVYDLTEPLKHRMICNGLLLRQCGEQFLHDGDVCNLGSINLEPFAKNGAVDFKRLQHVTRMAVRMLDNVIDISDFPVDKVNNVFRGNRRIGLGIMGFADMLYKLGIGYNSPEGFATAEAVMHCIQETAHQMSKELAETKGVFPNWDKSIFKQRNIKMRNAALTNIAPTGTISMMFDVSGGVEPYFALAYYYKGILGGQELSYVNKHLRNALEEEGIYSTALMDKIIKEGSLQHLSEIPNHIKRVYVTSMDISSKDHTHMQAAFQKYCDNAISKTINFPHSATKEEVLQGYILAWELGCKGCTVYRDGSRELQVLNLNKDAPQEKKEAHEEPPAQAIVVATDGKSKHQIITEGTCPECKSKLTIGEGCYTCTNCGSSMCTI